ncbi:hypothetical protein KWF55_16680 [Acinetobacter pittii]|jgi:hypothetical protein|uniref:hypothetical protein n=1 Tax=Acinetobacter TaxID=469 RepID=UPI00355BEDEE
MKRKAIPFKKVYFFEILCEFPWKSGMLLTIFFYIAAIWDVCYSFFIKKQNNFKEVDGVFNTLINQDMFLIWIFFILFVFYFFQNIFLNYRLLKGDELIFKNKKIINFLNYSGFFMIENFYLLAIFCFHTIILTFFYFDFHSTLVFFIFFIYFITLSIYFHWWYLSVRL